MVALLRLSRVIDAINERVGRATMWLVLLAALVSAGNALFRYSFNMSSNAWLEIQWYLFALIFLLGAGYTLKHNGHVRIDVLYGRLAPRTRAWIDLAGSLLFLLPTAGLIAWLSWPALLDSYLIGEMSSDAGGLSRWPIKLAIPVGFTLLALQGLSEAIKRLAFLLGKGPLPGEQAEEVA
ncbi:MAG: C4-dicarboxylate ABC transporter [Hydrogenophilales bacterium CG03_land_8_20_14_0_80_62_28]|nr:TRAP transporter small permease subunit [Betaproteobacteria bacterium]OIO76804.1 MAG: C4-dicarboxylate ABC transporter [Hydrogenophilaceae bacterium CG1_02_62_390]PIV23244.1 MAG: C4-dicarboxylate ABC transporter [Hydrogenophilales bacterium CG03_land_8_20_14_0_80_62_28]PIW37815.1 MAG: C4-dicarboxylate ABC transporter [Hydrogenophilales bacterium CG15_BIG_FIL_POST_REV_8_21_14_020_62_31]PIW72481.1 MAG: C4-dicarboxylate ABC transporter [Hydrogenophilales bacterium CG12_big_fil_rev_8_21_14_0_65_